MKRLVFVIILALASIARAATPIADTLYLANGEKWAGRVEISWDSFTTAAGVSVARGAKTLTVTLGVLSVALEPNEGATPSGTAYTVRWSGPSTRWTETWVVPASASPVTLATIRKSSTLLIFPAQLDRANAANGQCLTYDEVAARWKPGNCAEGTSGGGAVSSVAGRIGAVVLSISDILNLQTTLGTKNDKTANLGDVSDVPTSRNNLGLGDSATRNVGTFPGTVAAGDDSRMTNARTPTAHASTHSTGQADAITPGNIGAVATNDARLTDARTPTSHAASHAAGQADEVTPSAIGAMPTVSGTGTLMVSSGTPARVSGAGADCVKVDGTSGACGTGGSNLPSATFADPPPAPSEGDMYHFSDALSANECASGGGGAADAYCVWDGAAWVNVAGGNVFVDGIATGTSGSGSRIGLTQGTTPGDTNMTVQGDTVTMDSIVYQDLADGHVKVKKSAALGGAVVDLESGGEGAPPDGTGFTHVTSGVWDTPAELKVSDLPVEYICDATGGASNAYACTLDSAPVLANGTPGYQRGELFCIVPDANNAGSPVTWQFNSLGAVTVKKLGGTADLAANDIRLGHIACARYNGTSMDLQTPPGNASDRVAQLVVFDFATDTATGDGKDYFVVPAALNGMNLVGVAAQVITAGTTGTTDVQLARCATAASGNACSGTVTDMLSTKITIDSGENSTATAAAAAVINTSADDVATGQIIRVDVDAVSTTAAKGLIVTLTFRMP